MNKNDMLKEFISKYVLENWAQELSNINQRYYSRKEYIEKELVSAFDSVCRKAAEFQKQGLKGDTQYICISFLRTSIIENTSFYRIDAYDNRWFLDTKECYVMWDADFIFLSLFRQIEVLMDEKKQFNRMITDMDIDCIKLAEALKYHILAVEFVRSMILELIQCTAYKQMGKTSKICIMMGEFRDFSEVLYGDNEVKV